MRRNLRLKFAVFLVPLLAGALGAQAQQSNTDSGTAVQTVKDRAMALYQAIQKDDRVAALALVASESKNDFLKLNNDGLLSARVKEVHLEKSGDAATVTILRTRQVPQFTTPLDYETQETWKLIEGQWYLVLPSAQGQEVETPFGKMKFGQTPANAAQVEQKMKQKLGDVDPDQALKALQKAATPGAQTDNKTKTDDKKPDDKKPDPKKPEEKKPDKPQS